MDASAQAIGRPVPHKRPWLSWVLWAVAVLVFVGGVYGIVKSAPFPRSIAQDPVRTEATVIQSVTNGFGGDISVEYLYRVGAHIYKGEGFGTLGHESMPRPRGAKVAIEYAADAPSESCTCDAAREAPAPLSTAIATAAGLALPLVLLISWRLPRLWRTRHSWFAPVHGFADWVAILVGIPLGLGVVAFVFAWFFAISLER
jgi:hypothetical protein